MSQEGGRAYHSLADDSHARKDEGHCAGLFVLLYTERLSPPTRHHSLQGHNLSQTLSPFLIRVLRQEEHRPRGEVMIAGGEGKEINMAHFPEESPFYV